MAWIFNDAQIDAHAGNLLAAWKLDETSGNRSDIVAAFTLTDVGGVASKTGKYDLGADFDHNDDALNYAGDVVRNKAQISASLWFYFDQVSIDQTLVYESVTGSDDPRLWITVTNTDVLLVGMRDAAAGALLFDTSVNTFSATAWYHLLAVIDTTGNNISAWVNGVEWINSAVVMGNFENGGVSQEGFDLGAIYGAVAPVHSNIVDGIIDEVVLWDTALVLADATALYNGGLGRFLYEPRRWDALHRVISPVDKVPLDALVW